MKIKLVFIAALMLIGLNSVAQKTEVLYFKANLPCCPGRACNALETDVKSFIESNFNNETVVFKQVKISDEANAELVTKHNARSQTVVIVTKENNSAIDVSDIVKKYSRNKNKEEFEGKLVAKINESIK